MESLPGTVMITGIVKKIAQQGMPQIFHMYPDLMGSSRFQRKRCQGGLIGGNQNPVVGDGLFSQGKAMLPNVRYASLKNQS